MISAKQATWFTGSLQRLSPYRNNIAWILMGSFWAYAGIDGIVGSASGHHAKYIVDVVVGAFIVGVNAQPFLRWPLWLKRQWESEDV